LNVTTAKFGLGLEPVEPGFVSWQAVPLLLDNTTLSWVRGAMPTPHVRSQAIKKSMIAFILLF